MIYVKDIINICDGELISKNGLDLECIHFCTDTRKINNGDIYVGIKGDSFNGNNFYKEAFEKGASACILDNDTEIDDESLLEIASRSRGTPRIANRLLKRVRDYADVKSDGKINLAIAQEALNLLEIDELGLDNIDRIMLNAIINKFSGGPVGLDTLAASIGEDADTIEDVYEPYLLQLGFINRTPRGRIVTKAGYQHMGQLEA